MSEENLIQRGIFFDFINGTKESVVKHLGKEFSERLLLPKVYKQSIISILSSNTSVKFLGITSDQQLYRPKKDVYILVTALNYPNHSVEIVVRKNGALWFEDNVELSPLGLLRYILSSLDIGKYDVSAAVKLADNTKVGIGNISFDVAVFELDPFQVIIETQTMSQSQNLTVNVKVSILNKPYSGPLKVGLYCSYCKEVVLRDGVTCMKGRSTISFNVSGHTAPFSLEFIVPKQGYTAMIQLEGTMPHQRVPTPITTNLKQNYQMSLFPQTGSIDSQGINITSADVNSATIFEVNMLVGDNIQLKVTEDTDLTSLTIFNPINQGFEHQEYKSITAGKKIDIIPGQSHVIVFFAGIVSDLLVEGFFVAFRPSNTIIQLEAPTSVEAGGNLTLKLTNPSEKKYDETEVFLLVFDKRKTHSSLYKAIGARMHSHLKNNLVSLPQRIEENYKDRMRTISGIEDDMDEEIEIEDYAMAPPPQGLPGGGPPSSPSPASSPRRFKSKKKLSLSISSSSKSSGGKATPYSNLEHKSSEDASAELFEDFEEVLAVESFKLEAKETKVVNLILADQITTWEVRIYAFQSLRFTEIIENISAVKTKYIQIRSPAIVDAENGDSAEIEIHYLTEIPGMIEVSLDNENLIAPSDIKEGSGVLKATIGKKGIIHAIIKTSAYTIEAFKEVLLPFEQQLLYTHMVHLQPHQPFSPQQEVSILSNPLPLIRESVHELQGYPFGCAEQASAKLGALALAFKYYKAIQSGEEVPILGMIKQGLGNLLSLYYNDSEDSFGLWNKELFNRKTTMQVLRNLVPLFPLLDEFNLGYQKHKLNSAAQSLIKDNVKSYKLGVFSSKFIPKDEVIKDPMVAAWALQSSDVLNRDRWLKVIQENAKVTEETCKWESPLAWAGELQVTPEILRALIRHEAYLNDDLKKLYSKGFHYVMNNMVNGRLFSTTDTLALIGLFTDIPIIETKIKKSEEIIEIKESYKIKDDFTAQTHVYLHWNEEKLLSPFKDLPPISEKLQFKVDKKNCKIGDELKLVINAPSDLFCPVAAICFPPHVAMLKGGGNVQQHYLPFRGDKTILLELVCIRNGTGHIRVIVHDMYDKKQVIKPNPLMIKIA